MDEWLNGWMPGRLDVLMAGWLAGRMGGWVDGIMDV